MVSYPDPLKVRTTLQDSIIHSRSERVNKSGAHACGPQIVGKAEEFKNDHFRGSRRDNIFFQNEI